MRGWGILIITPTTQPATQPSLQQPSMTSQSNKWNGLYLYNPYPNIPSGPGILLQFVLQYPLVSALPLSSYHPVISPYPELTLLYKASHPQPHPLCSQFPNQLLQDFDFVLEIFVICVDINCWIPHTWISLIMVSHCISLHFQKFS